MNGLSGRLLTLRMLFRLRHSRWLYRHSRWLYRHSHWLYRHSRWLYRHSRWLYRHSRWLYRHSRERGNPGEQGPSVCCPPGNLGQPHPSHPPLTHPHNCANLPTPQPPGADRQPMPSTVPPLIEAPTNRHGALSHSIQIPSQCRPKTVSNLTYDRSKLSQKFSEEPVSEVGIPGNGTGNGVASR